MAKKDELLKTFRDAKRDAETYCHRCEEFCGKLADEIIRNPGSPMEVFLEEKREEGFPAPITWISFPFRA